jgi:hypothetical protein
MLSMAIEEFDISKAAINTVSIGMFEALFISTINQARRSPINGLSTLHQIGS